MEPSELKLILATIRRSWNRYPERYRALNRCKLRWGIYGCEGCRLPHPRKKIQVDHISPVIPTSGFDSIEGYVTRLFCKAELLQVLCLKCHRAKSAGENTVRVRVRRTKKGEKRVNKKP